MLIIALRLVFLFIIFQMIKKLWKSYRLMKQMEKDPRHSNLRSKQTVEATYKILDEED